MVVGDKHPLLMPLLLLFVKNAATLTCYQGSDESVRSVTVKENYCLFYEEYPSSACSNVPRIYGAVNTALPQLDKKCGAFTNKSTIIAACFCNTNDCNTIENSKMFLQKSVTNPSISSDVSAWKIMDILAEQEPYLACMLDRMPMHRKPPTHGIGYALTSVGIFLFCLATSLFFIVMVYAKAPTKKEIERERERAEYTANEERERRHSSEGQGIN